MAPNDAVIQQTIRHAIDAGYLSRQQLREALLLQEQLRAAGRDVPLLALLGAKFLRPEHVPELSRRYRELLAAQTSPAAPAEPEPPVVEPEPEVHVPQELLSRSCELAMRPPEEDPEPVRRFMDESSQGEVDDRVFVSLAKRAGYPAADVLKACRKEQLERRRRGDGPASLFALACARGALDERARLRFVRWAAQVAARTAGPLAEDDEPGAARPPRVLHESAATFQVEEGPRCAACNAELEDVAAEGKALCGGCAARAEQTAARKAEVPASARLAAPVAEPPRTKKPVRKALRESAAFIARGLSRAPRAAGDPPRAPRLVAIVVVVSACGLLAGVILAVGVALTRPTKPSTPPAAPTDQAADAAWRKALAAPPTEAAEALRRFAREHGSDPRASDAIALTKHLQGLAKARTDELLDGLLAEGRRLADDEPAAAHAVLDAAVTIGRQPASSEAAQARDAVRGRAIAALNRARSELRPLSGRARERALEQALELAARWRGLGEDESFAALVVELARPAAATGGPATEPARPPREPTITPPSAGTPTPAPTPDPARPAEAPVAAGDLATRAWSLYCDACAPFDAEDPAGVAAVLAKLVRLAPQAPETHAVRGFQLSLSGQHAEAAQALASAGKVDDVRVVATLVRSAFLAGDHAAARAAAPRLPADERAVWLALLDGPFLPGAPLAAAACELLSPERRYRVVSDVGVDLARLEARLAQAKPDERDELITKARRANRGLNELADLLDKAARAYETLLGVEPRARLVPSVYVFSSQAAFATFCRALGGGASATARGFYAPTWRTLCFYEEGARPSPETVEAVLQETFRQWLHLHAARAPLWFSEGLAEYFGVSELTSNGLRCGLVPRRRPSRLDNLRWALTRQHGMPAPSPLATLLRARHDAFQAPERSVVNYAHAWSIAHFLAASRGGRKLLEDYFAALREGKDLDGAFEAVFAGKVDLAQLEREWRDHIDGLK